MHLHQGCLSLSHTHTERGRGVRTEDQSKVKVTLLWLLEEEAVESHSGGIVGPTAGTPVNLGMWSCLRVPAP